MRGIGRSWTAARRREWNLIRRPSPHCTWTRPRTPGPTRLLLSLKIDFTVIAMSDDLHSLEGFSRVARLFPLPNLVMFPSVVQPLSIFEPRYRQMMADALEDNRLLA